MKKYKVTISTSTAYDLEIEAENKDEAWSMANDFSSDEVEEKSYDSSPVDGFPMVASIEEVNDE
jgi:hypothetical protein